MKSLLDWVGAAGVAKGPDGMQCLREAEALVERASHWAMLAEAWAVRGADGHDDARRCADRAVAHDGADVCVYSEAAKVHARQLHDLPAARRILDHCFDKLAAGSGPRAGDWRSLAGGYAWLLADPAAARRCLERGDAASVADLCALAGGYVDYLDDRATARGLIERAMALAEAAGPSELGHHHWSVANLLRHALDDPDAAWRFLERGLERASSLAGCLHIAAAVSSHAGAEPAHRSLELACVAKAESCAESADDWLAVAAAWHEHRADPAKIRRCLAKALASTSDDAVRARVAFGHRHWLGDAAAADRISARGVAPAALIVAHRRLEQWESDPAGLLEWLRARLTPKALITMSVADFGSARETHLAALRDLQATGLIPQPLLWHPREVLARTRWSDGEKTDHMARAFACTVLCIDAAGPVHHDGHAQTIPVLLESCLALGDEAVARSVGLLVTLAEAFEDFRHELSFAYLGLMLAAAARDPHDPRLAPLAERLIASVAETGRYAHDGPGWLLGQTRFDARHGLWRSLTEDLLGKPARAEPSLAYLADIADRLRGSG